MPAYTRITEGNLSSKKTMSDDTEPFQTAELFHGHTTSEMPHAWLFPEAFKIVPFVWVNTKHQSGLCLQ